MKDAKSDVPRQVLIGLGALLATALVIGVTVSVVALGAANLAGVGSGSGSAQPSLYRPATTAPRDPVESEQPSAAPAKRASQAPPALTEPAKADPKKRDPLGGITLQANPARASTNENIYLTGNYRGREGATLQVQRFEGRWVDFPASATVRGGRFETYVVSGQDGQNKFRVIDHSTGRASKPASVILH